MFVIIVYAVIHNAMIKFQIIYAIFMSTTCQSSALEYVYLNYYFIFK